MSSNLLSGIKLIPREKINKDFDKPKIGKKSRKERSRRSGKYESSDGEVERMDKRVKNKRKKQKWSTDEELSSSSSGSGTESSSSDVERKRKSRKRGKSKKRSVGGIDDETDSEDSGMEGGSGGKKDKGKGSRDETAATESKDFKDDKRKEMGLDWMLRPKEIGERKVKEMVDEGFKEPQVEEIIRENPRELNPYFKNAGDGYPEEENEGVMSGNSQLFSTSVVGDGGASWRLKALKRAQEQAAREGKRVEEVVGERWGSLSQLSIPAKVRAAPYRAHLHAIKSRQKGVGVESQGNSSERNEKECEQNFRRDYLKDVSVRHPEMKAPKIHDSLSWGKGRSKDTAKGGMSYETTTASLRDRDRSHRLDNQQDVKPKIVSESIRPRNVQDEPAPLEISKASDVSISQNNNMSANQLAAKALQLRMKGKHEEAEELQREVKQMNQTAKEISTPRVQEGSTSRVVIMDKSLQRRKDESDDMHLAQTILQNKKFSISGQADDEYDYDGAPQKKSKKKGGSNEHKPVDNTQFAKRIITQQERCQFCFENPSRPKHLVLSIANFTYLMLPQRQPVVEGHCCIVTMQHESATRSVDNNVWDEIRNFKKCLIRMFGKKGRDVVFLETVMGLAQRRRHCLVECIPIPQDIARQAPLYFKKAIDEAEDEWSQHNAKKLIDTSKKGLRGSIPKDFPYFYVEFGLDKGYVHVIDNEKEFNGSIGLNVIRGMLQLADEDMYRRRRHESVDSQLMAKQSFMQEWQPFDWTKQLD